MGGPDEMEAGAGPGNARRETAGTADWGDTGTVRDT